jgi:hypothetical protein
VWTGIGVTKTKPQSTIFVTNIPHEIELEQVRALFVSLPGYISFRTVRKLAFVDFQTIPQATEAMRTGCDQINFFLEIVHEMVHAHKAQETNFLFHYTWHDLQSKVICFPASMPSMGY